jgi:hypothetical protein
VGQPGTARIAPQHRRPVPAAGAEGNEKLTAMTGAILLVGFAVEGFTVLQIHRLLFLHFLVGLLLIGPVTLKIASTIYRFVRYYTGAAPYLRKGPPAPVLRLLGPLVILTSVAVLGTGVLLAVVGRGGPWLFLHKASFVLWFGVMTIHVINYAPRLPRMLGARSENGRRSENGGRLAAVPGSAARWLLLAASLAAGVGVAAMTMSLSGSWGVSF